METYTINHFLEAMKNGEIKPHYYWKVENYVITKDKVLRVLKWENTTELIINHKGIDKLSRNILSDDEEISCIIADDELLFFVRDIDGENYDEIIVKLNSNERKMLLEYK